MHAASLPTPPAAAAAAAWPPRPSALVFDLFDLRHIERVASNARQLDLEHLCRLLVFLVAVHQDAEDGHICKLRSR